MELRSGPQTLTSACAGNTIEYRLGEAPTRETPGSCPFSSGLRGFFFNDRDVLTPLPHTVTWLS